MCGFDPHSSPEIFFQEKKILELVYKCYSLNLFACSISANKEGKDVYNTIMLSL